MPEEKSTLEAATKVPDKVTLLWIGIVTVAVGFSVPYGIFLSNQRTLQNNDIQIQERISEIVDAQQRQAIDINTLTVRFDSLIERINSEGGP